MAFVDFKLTRMTELKLNNAVEEEETLELNFYVININDVKSIFLMPDQENNQNIIKKTSCKSSWAHFHLVY